METYILKFTLCSTVLIILFYLFLEKEKSFKFNRFYLIFAVSFSYLIPFFSIKLPQVEQVPSTLIFQEAASEMVISNQMVESSFNWEFWLFAFYAAVSIFLLMKSALSISKILNIRGKYQNIDGQRTKILKENISPFSFFGTLYLGENYLINNKIDERIFLHEKNHIKQKHSLDLLFIEILIIISWFNPALYFYKRAIVANHEFLADENVLQKNFEIKPYQQLILEEISTYQNRNFTHQFNFNNTKKRFIMMTKPDSKFATIKKIVALPAFALLFVLFAQKTQAINKAESEVSEKSNDELSFLNKMPLLNFDKEIIKIKNDTIKKPTQKVEKVNRTEITIDKSPSAPLAPPPPPPPPSDIEQTPPEYPGGINKFRQSVGSAFNTAVFKGGEGRMETSAYLSIDDTGKVTDVFAEGSNEIFNKETIRTLKQVTENDLWKPAEEKGVPVKSVFRMPLKMYFEY